MRIVHRGSLRSSQSSRPARSVAAVVIYLVGFVILLLAVSHYYLFPAYEATRDANHVQKQVLSAYARLVLAIVLFILLIGLLLTFKIGRFFRPRPTPPRKPTKYVDAWEESGRRLKLPEEDGE
jgi:hypothetical protein